MSEAATVRIVDRVATVAELRELARAVDWLDHYDWPSMGRALARSTAGVVALDDDGVVGAARMVGDGVRYFYVQDVLVEPDHTDEGIASRMVQRLLDVAHAAAPSDPFIGLFSSPEARGVYEGLGFAADDTMTGMHRG
jgi:GNAT superfamily N-acetyltransferase